MMDKKQASAMLSSIANRFKEPSSWAGIAAIAGMFGYALDPSLAKYITMWGSGLAGIVAFFVPEA